MALAEKRRSKLDNVKLTSLKTRCDVKMKTRYHRYNGLVALERYSKLVQDTSNRRGAAFPECSRGIGAETGWGGFLLMMSMD